MKKILFTTLFILGVMTGAVPLLAAESTVIYFFWGDGCPHCAHEKPFLEEMEAKYPDLEVKSFETWKNKENAELLQKMAAAYGIQARGVPATFIGNFDPIVGYADYMAADIENKIASCLESGCIDPGVKTGLVKQDSVELVIGAETDTTPPASEPEAANEPGAEIDKADEADPGGRTDEGSGATDEFETENFITDIQIENQPAAESEPDESATDAMVCVHLFYQDNCSQCQSSDILISDLEYEYNINLVKHNVSSSEENELFATFKEKYGLAGAALPIVFIGDRYLIGQDTIHNYLEGEILFCEENSCICPADNIRALTPAIPRAGDAAAEKEYKIDIPFLGAVNVSNMPLYLMTGLIAFVDGFNPCSLWVITFLLGIVVYSGSRKKIFIVGITFISVATLLYGLFILGLFNTFALIGYMIWIKIAVALVALVFGLVNIKDYFWYKKGISFTIPDRFKPKIFKDARGLMKKESMFGLMLGTIVMSFGVTFIELICTAGFPVIWTSILAEHHAGKTMFAILFALYMLIYFVDEFIVFGAVLLTLKASKFEENQGRVLKLIGGMIMLALAGVWIVKPEMMNKIGGMISVFGISIALAFLVYFIHRRILPKFGINIGTKENELKPKEQDGTQVDKTINNN